MRSTFITWYRNQLSSITEKLNPTLLDIYNSFLYNSIDVSSIQDLDISIVSGVQYARNQEEAVINCKFNLVSTEIINQRIIPLF